MDPLIVRAVVGLAIVLAAGVAAVLRLVFLWRLVTSGRPTGVRLGGVGRRVWAEIVEVLGQAKLFRWSVPGLAHAFAFWGFLVLVITVIEAFVELFVPRFTFPLIGSLAPVRFVEDLFSLLVLAGVAVFVWIRLRHNPAAQGRASRFFGSHSTAAWLVLLMIFNVIWTLVLYRGAAVALDGPTAGAFLANLVGSWMTGAPQGVLWWTETVGIWLHLAVIAGFLLIVLHSKHLHIITAPVNVALSRQPNSLGGLQMMRSEGALIDFEEADEDTRLGVGNVRDFTWKTLLDFTSCTECGRCQSVCPAWATGKPLSPKLMIMNMRDHAYASAASLFAGTDDPIGRPLVGSRAEDPLRATDGYDAAGHRTTVGAVVDEDALWSCLTCGACVDQCPVDIEHIDTFTELRRHQVLAEGDFPAELNATFRNIETTGNPWGLPAAQRTKWIDEVDFPVRVWGDGDARDVEWLFWVGCAGAFEERAKETTKAVAELLHRAGVSFMVLGAAESCTGDSARRAGNELLFHMQATANIELFDEAGVTKIVATCPHCLNTLANEYPDFGGRYQVVHHTQLLDELIAEGRLKPTQGNDLKVTFHDPCYLGRHNGVYDQPRRILEAIPGQSIVEMGRNRADSFCCGAGGGRMWMEEKLGSRVNVARADEALSTDAEALVTGCPFCNVMLHDGVASAGSRPLPVIDVSSVLLRSVRGAAAADGPPKP